MQGTLKFKVAVSFFSLAEDTGQVCCLRNKVLLNAFPPRMIITSEFDASGNKNIFFILAINTFLEKKDILKSH